MTYIPEIFEEKEEVCVNCRHLNQQDPFCDIRGTRIVCNRGKEPVEFQFPLGESPKCRYFEEPCPTVCQLRDAVRFVQMEIESRLKLNGGQ